MNKKKFLLAICIVLCLSMLPLAACSAGNMSAPGDKTAYYYNGAQTGDDYREIVENPVVLAEENPVSTFSLAVHTAGYTNLRRYINSKNPIPSNMIKIDEIVNYFDYDYPAPAEGEPVSISAAVSPCPWNEDAHLMTVGVKAEEKDTSDVRNNIVFLVDVSGSMNSDDKLGLAKEAFLLLTDKLDENDRVSIVTYSGRVRTLLRGASGSQKDKIKRAINKLRARGSTAGAGGIQNAYSTAQDYYIEGGNNRVILATDGDFNVGIRDPRELKTFISEKRQTGIYLSCLGFGSGNLQDDTMEALANSGNGNYYYIDSIREVERVFGEEMNGVLHTVARDAKVMVHFNPAKVYSYRLIGYENSLITTKQWEDTATDAGEIGSGFAVTAVYEVVLEDNPQVESIMEDNLFQIQMRYKSPDTSDPTEHQIELFANASCVTDTPNEDIRFIACLVETCLALRLSTNRGCSKLDNVLARLNDMDSAVSDPYRAEFKALLQILISEYDYHLYTDYIIE